jgi:hypothetical protein
MVGLWSSLKLFVIVLQGDHNKQVGTAIGPAAWLLLPFNWNGLPFDIVSGANLAPLDD